MISAPGRLLAVLRTLPSKTIHGPWSRAIDCTSSKALLLEQSAAFPSPFGREATAPARGDGPAAAKPETPLNLAGMEVLIDPRAEWKQEYSEVWRIERDFFYDPNLHGLNLLATSKHYEAYLENVGTPWSNLHPRNGPADPTRNLEKAVSLVMDSLKMNPLPVANVPNFPIITTRSQVETYQRPPREATQATGSLYHSAMALHLGTSGWSYPIWKPAFFPEKLPPKRFLEFYSTQLNAVELNATFRRFPTASSIQNWVGSTTPDFRFAAKAHQVITHFRRLKDADGPVRSYLESLEPMRQSGKLGPILFQTPPNLQADTALLEAFVQLLPQAYQFAFEFRHASWFSDATFETLKKRKNAALCWAQSEKIAAPKVATSDFLYYRFRLPEYSKYQLNKIAEELATQPQKEVFAFFKHEENPESALNATYVARMLGIEEKPFVMPAAKKPKNSDPGFKKLEIKN